MDKFNNVSQICLRLTHGAMEMKIFAFYRKILASVLQGRATGMAGHCHASYLRLRLASGGIVSLGVRLSHCHAVCVSVALVSAVKIMRASFDLMRASSFKKCCHASAKYFM